MFSDVENKIKTVYLTRCLIAEEMEEVAKLLKDPRTLDRGCDEGYSMVYEGLIQTLTAQVDLENMCKTVKN